MNKDSQPPSDPALASASGSETPRTDRIRDMMQCDSLADDFSTWLDHARELETELTVANRRIAEYQPFADAALTKPKYAHGFGGINADTEIHEKIQTLSSDMLLSAETTLSLLTNKMADEYRRGGSSWLPDHMQRHSNIRAAILRVRNFLCNEAERMTGKSPNAGTQRPGTSDAEPATRTPMPGSLE